MSQVYATCSPPVNGAYIPILVRGYAPFAMPKEDPRREAKKQLGERLCAARLECELTQAEAAEQIGITKAALSAWEVGRNLPDSLMLGKIARVYETTADALLWGGLAPNKELVEAMRIAIRSDSDYITRSALKGEHDRPPNTTKDIRAGRAFRGGSKPKPPTRKKGD